MNRADWFTPKLRLLRQFGWLALVCVPFFAAAAYLRTLLVRGYDVTYRYTANEHFDMRLVTHSTWRRP